MDPKETAVLPIRALGWLLGGLSILNLADDLSRVSLYGKLKVWVDAYAQMIETVGPYVFGWMRFGWAAISPRELHVLVLAGICCSAYARAESQFQRTRGQTHPWLTGMMTGALYFGAVLLAALLLPSWGGLVGASVVLLAASFIFFFVDGTKSASGANARRELAGAVIVFLVLLAVNYSVFRN